MMFHSAILFNSDISKWDVSSVTDMHSMFHGATSFTGDISKWDVSSVTNMWNMFNVATSFNGDISKWHVSSVGDMSRMFQGAKVFNCDISKWDVSNVLDMRLMFMDAVSFNHKLCGASWVRSYASKERMFTGSSGSISRTECTSGTASSPRYVSRRPITERELIARTPISTPDITSTIARTMTCSTCGTFRKSGRVSCCAPGGAWYKNCGGFRNRNVGHRWFEGVQACKRTF